MRNPLVDSARRRRLGAAWLVAALLATALRAPVASLPLERDEGEYAYIARRWLEGEPPYRETFDQKPPMVFVWYALSFLTLGDSPAAIHWGLHGVVLATLAVLMVLADALGGTPVALAAGILAAWLLVDPFFLGNAANTETYALLPLCAAALSARRAAASPRAREALLAGVWGAAALLTKPVVLPAVLILFGPLAGRRSEAARKLGLCVLATSLVLAAAVGALIASGSWDGFSDAVIRFNAHYASMVPLRLYPGQFWKAGSRSWTRLLPVYALAAMAVPVVTNRGARSLGFGVEARSAVRWLWLWLVASLVGVASGGWFRPHYFLLVVPPLVLLAGFGVKGAVHLAQKNLAPGRSWPASLVLATLLLASVGLGVRGAWWYFGPHFPRAKMRRLYGDDLFVAAVDVGHFVEAHTKRSDRVFVYGSEPEVLVYARRRSATRYIYVYPLMFDLPGVGERQLEALREIGRARPPLVVQVLAFRSFARTSGAPLLFDRRVRSWLVKNYRVRAVALHAAEGPTPIVEGEAAEKLRREDLLAPPSRRKLAFVIWRRRAAAR